MDESDNIVLPNGWENILHPMDELDCPIHKNKDKLIQNNYRGMSLMRREYKLFKNILRQKITPYKEENVGECQSVFKSRQFHTWLTAHIEMIKLWEYNVCLLYTSRCV